MITYDFNTEYKEQENLFQWSQMIFNTGCKEQENFFQWSIWCWPGMREKLLENCLSKFWLHILNEIDPNTGKQETKKWKWKPK